MPAEQRDAMGTRDLMVAYANPFILCGKANQQEGRFLEASDDYARAHQILPDSPEIYSDLASIAAGLGMAELAEGFCRKALFLDSNYPAAWYNLGNVFALFGQWDEALDAYAKFSALNPAGTVVSSAEALVRRMKAENAPAQVIAKDAVFYKDAARKWRTEGRKVLADEAEETASRLRIAK
jgi:tetratricopeptide (TPR) repeat protein